MVIMTAIAHSLYEEHTLFSCAIKYSYREVSRKRRTPISCIYIGVLSLTHKGDIKIPKIGQCVTDIKNVHCHRA